MSILYVKIVDITCDNCRNKIKKELLTIKGIRDVEVLKNIAKITLTEQIDEVKIINVINSLGYFTKKDYISKNIKDIDDNITKKRIHYYYFLHYINNSPN